jgi:hypothetical protein
MTITDTAQSSRQNLAAQSAPAIDARRDHRGRWRDGVSGNPAGRPVGLKNRQPRRRADRERTAEWTVYDWQIFFGRAFRAAAGAPAEKHAAALAECTKLWVLFHPLQPQPGLCAHCNRELDPLRSSVNGAPVCIDGAWIHLSCQPFFLRTRWDTAKEALRQVGIIGNAS